MENITSQSYLLFLFFLWNRLQFNRLSLLRQRFLLARNGLQFNSLLGFLFLLLNRFGLFKLNLLWSFGFLDWLLLSLFYAFFPVIGFLDFLLLFFPRAKLFKY